MDELPVLSFVVALLLPWLESFTFAHRGIPEKGNPNGSRSGEAKIIYKAKAF